MKAGVVAKTSPVIARQNFVVFFAIVYFSHGISCGQFGLIAQPLQFFMMTGLKLNAAQVSSCMAVMMLPWVIKPVYGLFCDFVPFFGYRRKSYVVMGNAVAMLGFLVISFASTLNVVLAALMFTAIGMAISTALMVGLAVEQGRKDGKSREYFAVQEFFYYGASIIAAFVGGLICQYCQPPVALHASAAAAVIPVTVVALLTALGLHETRASVSRRSIRATAVYLRRAFQSVQLRIVMTFSLLWCFCPAMGVPLYFFESNNLKFTQSEIGQLGALNSVGMLIGTVLYRQLMKRFSLSRQLLATIALACLSTLGYFWISSFASAAMLELVRGAANIIVILSLYCLAAEFCPPRVEVTVMALLVAFRNVATDASTFVGGQLFTHLFHNQLRPLVIVSLIAPLLSTLLMPLFFRSVVGSRQKIDG
ncbi:MAG: MFS transporter [Candidatus Melainabacteria bacterium]|nr:MAG: MFS transporter [Candidatus Melainabacteria bacterium]